MNKPESLEFQTAEQLGNGTMVVSEAKSFTFRREKNSCVYPFG